MSIKLCCDKCGKDMSETESTCVLGVLHLSTKTYLTRGVHDEPPGQEYNLCPRCENDLYSWMHEKR